MITLYSSFACFNMSQPERERISMLRRHGTMAATCRANPTRTDLLAPSRWRWNLPGS
jgi:hypothetical protein